MGIVVGIDLGTTTSEIAYIKNGKPEVIPNTLGSKITPSVVNLCEDGNILVGDMAKRKMILEPENTVIEAINGNEIKIIGSSSGRGTINPDKGETARIYFKGSGTGTFECRIFSLTGELVWQNSMDNISQGMFEWMPKNMASGGYVGGAATQTAAALESIKASFIILPGVGSTLIIVMLLFFDIEKHMPKIQAELKARREGNIA
jgi:hypothetical protein